MTLIAPDQGITGYKGVRESSMSLLDGVSERHGTAEDVHAGYPGLRLSPLVPGPGPGEVETIQRIVPPGDVSIETVDSLRAAEGAHAAVLYDVSPVCTTDVLFEKQATFPRVVVCDHHNGAAPEKEVPGLEVTGAQVIADTLPRMWEAGGLAPLPGNRLFKLLAVTSAANIDPDAFISRFLIESYCNPGLRSEVWQAQTLGRLLRAARFADTTFFGGIDIPGLRYENMPDHMRLAFALFQMINEEKIDLVVNNRIGKAIEMQRQSGQTVDVPDTSDRAAIRGYVFRWLTRQQVREVFEGNSHPPLFNPSTIEDMFASIVGKMVHLLKSPDDFRPLIEKFIADLQHVHQLGRSILEDASLGPDKKISIMSPEAGRLDREPRLHQSLQRHPIWDWLREASAAFGDPWIHVMNRPKSMVISSRFPREGEDRPYIDLAVPAVVSQLRRLERECADSAGEPPVEFLVKANLWLPLGKPHFSCQQAVDLLLASWDFIVSKTAVVEERPRMKQVKTADGDTIDWDGAYHYLREINAQLRH